jgi:hypothetical protein
LRKMRVSRFKLAKRGPDRKGSSYYVTTRIKSHLNNVARDNVEETFLDAERDRLCELY